MAEFGFCAWLGEIYPMNKMIVLGVCLVLAGCGGSLSDEQRKKLREGMESQKIVQISDSEIVTAAMDRGRQIFAEMERAKFDSASVNAIERTHSVIARWIVPGSTNARAVEQQLIEAYINGIATGAMQENIQKVYTNDGKEYDSLVYTKPVVTPMPDGVEQLRGIWNIYLSKRQVIIAASASR